MKITNISLYSKSSSVWLIAVIFASFKNHCPVFVLKYRLESVFQPSVHGRTRSCYIDVCNFYGLWYKHIKVIRMNRLRTIRYARKTTINRVCYDVTITTLAIMDALFVLFLFG